ncbi:MAG: hypothetical protein R3C41_21965 [Calditrichia bacterium]|nr:hypothetical protein [Calditrichota bacterium]MCB9066277.1 hypothetical protein [Calditrichia bacterium]
MKQIFLLKWLIVGLCCISIPAIPGETRVGSMGSTGIFTYDVSNLRTFPASVYRYPNLVISELRFKNQSNTFSAGVHLPLGDKALGALYLNRQFSLPFPNTISPTFGNLEGADFTLGSMIGENQVGFRIGLATEQIERTDSDSLQLDFDETATYVEFAGGVSSETYDFGAYFGLPYFKRVAAGVEEKWSGSGFGVSGRFFLGAQDGIQYVPVVLINQFSTTVEMANRDIDTDFLEFRMNLGFHYRINPQNLVILGVEMFGFSRSETDDPDSQKITRRITNMPAFFLGGETYAKKWLVLRLGAVQTFSENKQTISNRSNGKSVTLTRTNDIDVTVGVGIHIGNFLMDLDINDNYLFEGPDFISGQGANEVNDFVHRLTITYTF